METLQVLLASKDPSFEPGLLIKSRCEKYLNESRIESNYRQFIETHNGLYTFDRALHIFGCSQNLRFHDIETRNFLSEWRQVYDEAALKLIFFAEDIFGNLYAYSEDGIVFFDVESSEKNDVASDFRTWMDYIIDDIDYTTGRGLAQEWAVIHGPVPFGSRLCPRKPFIVGGEYEVENLFVVSWEEGLSLRADIARQIKDLPEGTDIEIELQD